MSNLKLWTPDPTVGKPIALRIINAVSIIAVFVVNGIASSGMLGRSTGELSDLYPVLITPAGYAFSIWGLIYALLAAFMIYQLLPSTYASRPINEAITFLVPVNAAMNIGWIFAWHYQTPGTLWLSIVFMLGIWISLATIYYRLIMFTPAKSYVDYICINLPFSLYLGWINVASILNAFIVFGGYVTPKTDAATVSLIHGLSIAALACVALAVTAVAIIRRDPVIAFVFTWAAIGIMANQSDETIDTLAMVSAIIVGVLAILTWGYNVFEIIKEKRVSWEVRQANYLSAESASSV